LDELSAIHKQSSAVVITRLKQTHLNLLQELRKLAAMLSQKLSANEQAAACKAEHDASK
jgi:hypothetical protein